MEDELYRDYDKENAYIAAQIQAEQDEELYNHLMKIQPEAKIEVKKYDRVEAECTPIQ